MGHSPSDCGAEDIVSQFFSMMKIDYFFLMVMRREKMGWLTGLCLVSIGTSVNTDFAGRVPAWFEMTDLAPYGSGLWLHIADGKGEGFALQRREMVIV